MRTKQRNELQLQQRRLRQQLSHVTQTDHWYCHRTPHSISESSNSTNVSSTGSEQGSREFVGEQSYCCMSWYRAGYSVHCRLFHFFSLCTVTDFSAGALRIGVKFFVAVRPHFRQVFYFGGIAAGMAEFWV